MQLEPVPGDYRPPGLVREPIYYADVAKRLISKVFDAVRAKVGQGTENMQHVKRVQPIPDQPEKLRVLLCSQSKISQDDLTSLVGNIVGYDVVIMSGHQAKYPARTKEEAVEWSKEVWPLMWRGNTAALPPQISDEDCKEAVDLLEQLPAPEKTEGCSFSCWIKDPQGTQIVGKGQEDLKHEFSRSHAVMSAIDAVAHANTTTDSTQGSEEGYLCLGMDVYCDTEPCVMCCMALIHSRIGRLFYRRPSASTKGAIEVYCLHGRSQLNHTYEAWKAVESGTA